MLDCDRNEAQRTSAADIRAPYYIFRSYLTVPAGPRATSRRIAPDSVTLRERYGSTSVHFGLEFDGNGPDDHSRVCALRAGHRSSAGLGRQPRGGVAARA